MRQRYGRWTVPDRGFRQIIQPGHARRHFDGAWLGVRACGLPAGEPAVTFPRNNNLEWLRLIFAVQVVFVHAAEHLNFAIPAIIGHFPGVPAFFFVSGFLIYASYLNAPGRRYFENRFLRLFPALVFVTLGGMAVALAA